MGRISPSSGNRYENRGKEDCRIMVGFGISAYTVRQDEVRRERKCLDQEEILHCHPGEEVMTVVSGSVRTIFQWKGGTHG